MKRKKSRSIIGVTRAEEAQQVPQAVKALEAFKRKEKLKFVSTDKGLYKDDEHTPMSEDEVELYNILFDEQE